MTVKYKNAQPWEITTKISTKKKKKKKKKKHSIFKKNILFLLVKGFSICWSIKFTILNQPNEQFTVLNFVGSFKNIRKNPSNFSCKFKILEVSSLVRGQHKDQSQSFIRFLKNLDILVKKH